MDGRRFDSLVRAFASGSSRRSVLKGLLGIGGAAATGSLVADHADARAIATRPTVPPPTTRPPAPPPTTTTTPCPAGQQQCPNSTVCCPTGTCARSGNQAICCTGHVCGHECCVSAFASQYSAYLCCDRECCAADHTCLTRVFPEGPNVEEEMCCPAHLACDNQCCDGACFNPVQGPFWDEEFGWLNLNGHPIEVAKATCCPTGGTVCHVDSGEHVCCDGSTPKCCPIISETPGACRPAGACCDAADCAADNPGTDAACWTCDAGACVPVLNDVVCGSAGEICCDQVCCAAGQICVEAPSGEVGPAQESHICVAPTTTTTTSTTTSTTTTTPECLPVGATDCAAGGPPCCSGYCISNMCAAGCSGVGGPCNGPLHCCGEITCNSKATCGCRPAGFTCSEGDCCAGDTCADDGSGVLRCQPSATTTSTTAPPCRTEGCTCSQTSDCNSGLVCLTTGRICASCVPRDDGPCNTGVSCCNGSLDFCSSGGTCFLN